MRRTLVTVALVLAPVLAVAQGNVDPFLQKPPERPKPSGLTLGVSVAYGIPMGSSTGAAGDDFSALYSHSIPLTAELGWRFSPQLYVGGFFQYAFASVGSSLEAGCNASGVSCSATDMRFGVDLRYTFAADGSVLPWVGIGAGYEIAKIGATVNGQSFDIFNLKGFEFGHVSVGVDFRAAPWLRVGPFATITFAQFSSLDTQVQSLNPLTIGASTSADIANKGFHEWLQLGIRGSFEL